MTSVWHLDRCEKWPNSRNWWQRKRIASATPRPGLTVDSSSGFAAWTVNVTSWGTCVMFFIFTDSIRTWSHFFCTITHTTGALTSTSSQFKGSVLCKIHLRCNQCILQIVTKLLIAVILTLPLLILRHLYIYIYFCVLGFARLLS